MKGIFIGTGRPAGGARVWLIGVGLAVLAQLCACDRQPAERAPKTPATAVVDQAPRDTLMGKLVAEFSGKARALQRRVLIVGWDGATFDMIDPLLAMGRLPNVAAMLLDGAQVNLESTILPISSAAWTSILTGKLPGKTGIYGFFALQPDSYAMRLVTGADRVAPPLWRVLNYHGLRMQCVGVPMTYPPEPMDGVLIAGMLSPFESDYAWPPGLSGALRKTGFVPDLEVWRSNHVLDEEMLETQVGLKEDLAISLAGQRDWSASLICFKSLDTLSHRVYNGETHGIIAAHYEWLDRVLGEMRVAAGPDTDVLLISDHGFGTFNVRLHVNKLLEELGLLAARAESETRPVSTDQTIEQIVIDAFEREIEKIDMSRTKVFCSYTEGNYATLRLNLMGREPAGIVAPGDAEAVMAEVEQKLRSFTLPQRGEPIIRNVWRVKELYSGPANANFPDLVFEAEDQIMCKPFLLSPVIYPMQKKWPEHRRTGILLAAGPHIARQAVRGTAAVEDVAPTVLHLLGLPVFAGMDGRVIDEILAEPGPVVRVPEPELAAPARDAVLEHGETKEIYDRLKALGYAGGPEDQPD